MIRALFLFASVLLVASLVWMAVSDDTGKSSLEPQVPKKVWVEFVDPENPSFAPGQVQLRVKTIDIPPVNKTCATRDASGGYTVNLNSKGESYFGLYKGDVNAAIEEALLAAETDLLAMAEVGWCEDQCAAVQGFGNAIVDDASALVSVLIGSYETGDTKCDPTNAGGMSPVITINAQAPGLAGVNLRAALESMAVEAAPSLPSIYADAFNKFRDDCIAEFELVAPAVGSDAPAGGSASMLLQPDGYPNAGSLGAEYFDYPIGYVLVYISVPVGVPGVGNTHQVTASAKYDLSSGSWFTTSDGGTVVGAGAYEGDPPVVEWGGGTTEAAPGFMPSSISLTCDNSPPPREINETIPLINSPDPQTWNVEPSFNDSPTTRLYADNSITIAYSYYQVQISPGVYEKRQNLFYRNIKPFLPLCMELQEMHHVALPETEFDPENAPPCVRRILPRPDLIEA
jgi:hypothetical protein